MAGRFRSRYTAVQWPVHVDRQPRREAISAIASLIQAQYRRNLMANPSLLVRHAFAPRYSNALHATRCKPATILRRRCLRRALRSPAGDPVWRRAPVEDLAGAYDEIS